MRNLLLIASTISALFLCHLPAMASTNICDESLLNVWTGVGAGDPDSPHDGKALSAFVLKDSSGKSHSFKAGGFQVDAIAFSIVNGAQYLCITTHDENPKAIQFPFKMASRFDLSPVKNPISAQSSGQGYGIRYMADLGEDSVTVPQTSCTYNHTEQVCSADIFGISHCRDYEVQDTGSCENGETEDDSIGRTIRLGIVGRTGKIVGTVEVDQHNN